MDKQRGTQTVIIALLAVAILVMSVGFAVGAFNSTLNIGSDNNVTLKKAKWEVKFKSGSLNEAVVPTATAPTATLSDTALNFTATLKYGEKYEFSAVIENSGTIDAKLSSITLSPLTAAQQKYLTYTVKYGTSNTFTASNNALSIPLAAEAEETVTVTVEYKALAADAVLPSTADETVTLSAVLNYVENGD